MDAVGSCLYKLRSRPISLHFPLFRSGHVLAAVAAPPLLEPVQPFEPFQRVAIVAMLIREYIARGIGKGPFEVLLI
jgi:hypothetical protein